jgi:16S rRNA processing protein RimM
MPDAPAHLIVGRVRRAHGLRGDLVVETLTDAPDAIFAAGRRVFGGTVTGELAEGPAFEVEHATPFKRGMIILRLQGIADRTTAEGWRDRYLLVPASEVEPPGESQAFLHELIGMRVQLVDGGDVGNVLDYYDLPQGILLEVEWNGARVTLPMSDAFVRDIDRERRRIVMELPDGLLE